MTPGVEECGTFSSRRRRVATFLLLALSLTTTAARSQEAQADEGLLGGYAGFTEGERDFDCLVLATRKHQSLDAWYRVPSDAQPLFAPTGTVHPNESFRVVLLLRGLSADEDGNARVTFDLSTVRADGKPGVSAQAIPAYEGPAPNGPTIIASRAVPSLAFDDAEPLGPMVVEVTAHDHVGDVRRTRRFALTLQAWRYGEVPHDGAALDAWMSAYHTDPQPQQAVRALSVSNALAAEEGRPWNPNLLHFFVVLFEENRWLVPALRERLQDAEPPRRALLSVLLQVLGEEAGEDAPALDDDEARLVADRVAEYQGLDPHGDLADPVLLDMLWAEFLATGRIGPVRAITAALGHAEDEGTLERLGGQAADEAELQAIKRDLTFRAARWSLGSMARQHALVGHYLLHLAQTGDRPIDGADGETARLQLIALLKETMPDRVGSSAATGEGDGGG